MNRVKWHLLIGGLCLCLIPLAAQTGTTAEPRGRKSPSAKLAAGADPHRGERVFKQNCSRCHDAPQSSPPQISGSIVRHMRVRASLSTADEKALLEFMNP